MKKINGFLQYLTAVLFLLINVSSAFGTTVDVMIVFDSTAKSWVDANVAGGMNVFAADVVARMNQATDNSSVDLNFRLARAAEVGYTYSGDFSKDLTRLQSDSDNYMNEVHTWRNECKADLVTMVVDTGSAYGTVGIGYILTSLGGEPDYAFTVSAIQSVDISHTLTHEVGHNLGCHHSKYQTSSPGPNTYLNTYSAGWYFTGTNSDDYHTIMAYNSDGYGNYYIEAPLFSTPLLSYEGTIAGDAVNGDNARNIRETMDVVSLYRISSTPDQFTFTDQTGVALNTIITSDAVTVSGIDTQAVISIKDGTYSINGGAYTSGSGMVNDGDEITVQVVSSLRYYTSTEATLTIGNVSDIFSVTTTPTTIIKNDFNGDGISDILWRNESTGQVNLWFMNADGTTASTRTLITDTSWTVADTGDFNADGIFDVLWRQSSTGKVVLWFMNADGSRAGAKTLITDTTWTVADTGDFNADGISDILWRQASSGKVTMWFMNADGSRAGAKTLITDTSWTVAGTSYFNADGIQDILWRQASTGKVTLWFMNADGTRASAKTLITDINWTVAGMGDFNDDGITDIIWRQPSTGKVTLWFMNADGTRASAKTLITDPNWTVAGTGDFNGDGITDIIWRQPSTGKVNLWFMNADGTRATAKTLMTDISWVLVGE